MPGYAPDWKPPYSIKGTYGGVRGGNRKEPASSIPYFDLDNFSAIILFILRIELCVFFVFPADRL
jgi:hypothetical protein